MPAFTGSVNPKLSYKSLVNMGQKARKHWAHVFMWMLVWFLPLKMLLQTRQKHLTMATSPPSSSNHWGGGRGEGISELPELDCSVESWEQGTEHCALQSANTHIKSPHKHLGRAGSFVSAETLWVYGWTVQRCLAKKILVTLLKWLSYLSVRYFRIPINNCMSSSVHSIFGVPQGSVLGPAMYSFYMLPMGHLNSFKGIFYHC